MPPKGYRKPKTACIVPGCGNPSLARGWCSKHYARWSIYGDPIEPFRQAPNGSGHISKGGYRRLNIKGRVILEHRLVMENHLGRPLLPHEHIHHKDGCKLNNLIDNLELVELSDHARYHRQQRLAYDKKCPDCQETFPRSTFKVYMIHGNPRPCVRCPECEKKRNRARMREKYRKNHPTASLRKP